MGECRQFDIEFFKFGASSRKKGKKSRNSASWPKCTLPVSYILLYCNLKSIGMRKIRLICALFLLMNIGAFSQGIWTQKPSIGHSDYVERTLATGFEINGQGYIAGGNGVGRQNFTNSLNDVYRFTPAGNTWVDHQKI